MTVVVEKRVALASDDIEEKASGSISSNVTDLELGFNGSDAQKVGIRFADLGIPRGAIITSAYIQFTSDELNSSAASLLIRGENSDTAATFTNSKYAVSSRPVTDASAAWSPAAWTAKGVSGVEQRTSDLSAIVQEIVGRAGWSEASSMAFFLTGTGTRTAKSYELDAALAPLLRVEYTLPGNGAPVAFATPPDSDTAANQIAELAAAGAPIGITAAAFDPDPGDTVTFSIDDPRFSIGSNGAITRSGFGALDYETESSVTLRVTATSSDGSRATQDFTLSVTDSPEPVAFRNPADADAAANAIAQNAAAGTKVGITASAADPDLGSTVSYSLLNESTRFAIDSSTGVVTRTGSGQLNAGTEPTITLQVKATSSDGSTATHNYDVAVTGGQPTNNLPTGLTYVKTTLTSTWNPASPDPSGIAYISHLGTLLISDGEVNEMAIFAGKNVFQSTLNGQLISSFSTLSFSDEPSGIAYNPTNRHLFFADDTGTRAIYELDPGTDGQYGTGDDKVTTIKTAAFGARDPEGLTYDTKRGVLYLVSGSDNMIFTINPGNNGKFDGVPSTGGDDVVTGFSSLSLGIKDAEGIEYDPFNDVLYVTASKTKIAMITTTGELLGTFDISSVNARKPAGLAFAPSTVDPLKYSLYIVDRGIDNNADPNENDGKMYEFLINDDWALV